MVFIGARTNTWVGIKVGIFRCKYNGEEEPVFSPFAGLRLDASSG